MAPRKKPTSDTSKQVIKRTHRTKGGPSKNPYLLHSSDDKIPRRNWSSEPEDVPDLIIGEASTPSLDSVRSRDRPTTPTDPSKRGICICLSKTRGPLEDNKSEKYGWSVVVVDQGNKPSNPAEYYTQVPESQDIRKRDPRAQPKWPELKLRFKDDLYSKSHMCLVKLELILEVVDESKFRSILRRTTLEMNQQKVASSKAWVKYSLNELVRLGALKRRTQPDKITRPWESAWRRIEERAQEFGVLVDKDTRRWTQSLVTTSSKARRAEIPITRVGDAHECLTEDISNKPKKGKFWTYFSNKTSKR